MVPETAAMKRGLRYLHVSLAPAGTCNPASADGLSGFRMARANSGLTFARFPQPTSSPSIGSAYV